MDTDKLYDGFIEALHTKYPNKMQLVKELMKLLGIEREAIYRRLRKEVYFSFHEISRISSTWGISLDNLISVHSGKIPFKMHAVNYLTPTEQELKFLQDIIHSINFLKDFTDTEFLDICNKLPRKLVAGFGYLNRFYLFKWRYQYGGDEVNTPFSRVVISDEMLRLTANYYQAIKHVPQTIFLFDRLIFQNLVNEIQYFHSINLISGNEKELIKTDLFALLEYLSKVATTGVYPETRKKVSLYVSQLNVDTNYSYTCTNLANICFIHVFDKFEIHTCYPEMVENFVAWMQLRKRTSFQLSGVDEKNKVEFFQTQRQIVENL